MSSSPLLSHTVKLMPFSTFNRSLMSTFLRTSKNTCYFRWKTASSTQQTYLTSYNASTSSSHFSDFHLRLNLRNLCCIPLRSSGLALSFPQKESAMTHQTCNVYGKRNDPPKVVKFNSWSEQCNCVVLLFSNLSASSSRSTTF